MSDHHRPPDQTINVNVHLPALAELAALVIKGFNELRRDIHTMSSTLAEQLAAAQAETSAALDGIATDVSEIAADVDSLLAAAPVGSVLTQEAVDAMTAIRDRAVAAKAGLDAVNARVPATPAPEPPVA